ncbi:cysteine--tRNA ligase [Paenibacillus turpanensis]|uniref:cysteine--tRNA ligase n=1 Tax=Paenibacillus turpanensis TaxID=2689078 RepID=UPI00140B0DDF|nr:cysteine--tRNA ligase [Paenibacillus turpanensis]
MSLKIYNTVTKAKEPFEPIEAGKVSMYVCGPTVYDYIHIGNARPLIVFDMVRKYLEQLRYEVKYVVNFTDVDDKMIKKAESAGITVDEVGETYVKAFYEDTALLGVDPATIHPRVTENIPEIIGFIQELVDKGFAYANGGDVYFRTAEFKEYGKISHQNIQELQFGIRVEVDERKENPQDFVLWKGAKPGEPKWESPWGDGRPGWHIECSAMARKYLGETIDIHGGGQDLQFPHHECEVAQSEANHGQPMSRYWMHNGYLNIDGEKMSKSLANGIQVREIMKQVTPQTMRYFMLSTQYRNPLNFDGEALEQSKRGVERLQNSFTNVRDRLSKLEEGAAGDGEADAQLAQRLEAIRKLYHDKMQDDFNTPDAITAMFELVSEANLYIQRERVSRNALEQLLEHFQEMNAVLGILSEEQDELLDDEIERLIAERVEARKNKQWARADEIRDLLSAQGILLEDTPQGIRWKRK